MSLLQGYSISPGWWCHPCFFLLGDVGDIKQTLNFKRGGDGGVLEYFFHWSVYCKLFRKSLLIVFEVIFQYYIMSYSVLLLCFENPTFCCRQVIWWVFWHCHPWQNIPKASTIDPFTSPKILVASLALVLPASLFGQVFHLPPRVTYHHVTGRRWDFCRWVGVDLTDPAAAPSLSPVHTGRAPWRELEISIDKIPKHNIKGDSRDPQ